MTHASHGRLGVANMRSGLTAAHDVSAVPTLELALELTRRLQEGSAPSAYNARMLHCDVLGGLDEAIARAIDVPENRFSITLA
jgi:hypothetical protein